MNLKQSIETDPLLWTIPKTGQPFWVCPQFSSNPETASSWITVLAVPNLADKSGSFLQIDYDLQTGRFQRFQTTGYDHLREPLERLLLTKKKWLMSQHQMKITFGKKRLENSIFHEDFLDAANSMIGYGELIPNERFNRNGCHHPDGMFFVHGKSRYRVLDLYCARPNCLCHDVLLVFRSGDFDLLYLDYRSEHSYAIRMIPENRISAAEAERLIRAWIKRKPVWYTDSEIILRSRQMKHVMARTVEVVDR